MKKKISAILCICLLTGLASGCGSERNNLTEDSNTAAFVESSETETADAAALGNDQSFATGVSAGEIVSPEKPGWKQAYLTKAEEIETEKGLEYDLIYLDSDDIPELVAGPTGYWFTLYTMEGWRSL